MKTVRIKTAGCDIFPHGTVHQVLDIKNGVYPTLNESDRIPAKWCEEITSTQAEENKVPLFGGETHFRNGLFNLNEFRRYGYYENITLGERTGAFCNKDYEEFEKYIHEYDLRFEF